MTADKVPACMYTSTRLSLSACRVATSLDACQASNMALVYSEKQMCPQESSLCPKDATGAKEPSQIVPDQVSPTKYGVTIQLPHAHRQCASERGGTDAFGDLKVVCKVARTKQKCACELVFCFGGCGYRRRAGRGRLRAAAPGRPRPLRQAAWPGAPRSPVHFREGGRRAGGRPLDHTWPGKRASPLRCVLVAVIASCGAPSAGHERHP